MFNIKVLIITTFMTIARATGSNQSRVFSYEEARELVINAEDLLSTGGRLNLNSRESKVDDIFLKYKYDELANGFRDPYKNAAGMHFFKAKPLIDNSKVFKFLQKMPKGAVLHTHTSASVSSAWTVKNIFYMQGLMKCTNKDGLTILSFRKSPRKHGCTTQYVRVNDERKKSVWSRDYDHELENLINLHVQMPELEYDSINSVWKRFENMFRTLSDALLYLPAYRSYHFQMLRELYNDNVMYAEVRLNFYELYDISGRTFPIERTVAELINVVQQFKNKYPNFLGIKMIYSPNRKSGPDDIRKHFENFKKLHSSFPDYIIGFDLVGQEDQGNPLYKFANVLNDKPKSARFFFHAGETNWYGASTDLNLLDAILLNTTRIGHGYALIKHPVLWNAVKTRDIAVEVSPISNQVLHLLWDLRNHPGAFFISQNIPIVICNDDPGFWNAKALSYDFYYAIMSLAPNNAGLKLLKQLTLNSIKYSSLQGKEKQRAYTLLQLNWNRFIDDVLKGAVV